MCGIAGIFFKKEVDYALLDRFQNLVRQKQHQRGPDEFNALRIQPNLFFFHNMLSIIDVGNAKQPMEDEEGVITYNGEVYNYKELRYADKVYHTNSDTEVLLEGLSREGIAFLDKTNSMFGFGYFSKSTGLLTLCRDRIGIKSLYYIDSDEVFAFASTITPLTILSKKTFNHKKIWQYYLNRAFKAPNTILDDIFELPPGSYLEFNSNSTRRITTGKWWQRQHTTELLTNEDEVIETIEQLLIDSIKNRLVADVPIGLFLSGGVDSSLVAALTSKQASDLNAFTISFYDKRYDESAYAKRICEKFNIKYNEVKVHANDFLNSIDDWITIQDDIVADPSALLLFKLSQFASTQNYRVLLAGEGADELFCGYNSYKYFSWSQAIYDTLGKNIPALNTLKSVFKNDSKKYHFFNNSTNLPVFYGTAMIFEPHLLSKLIWAGTNGSLPKTFDIKHAMELDIKDRIPNDVLTRSDRSTSGASIELRVPFLSHQLVDFSAGIDSSLFTRNKVQKYLIKKLAAKYIDNDIIYRKKVGFDLPLKTWISNELKELMLYNINNSVQSDYIDMSVIKRCFDLHVNHGIDHSDKLWAFLSLELSYRHLSGIK